MHHLIAFRLATASLQRCDLRRTSPRGVEVATLELGRVRSPPSNSSLLFSPRTPKSALQQFAAALPSRAETRPPTVRPPLSAPSTRPPSPLSSQMSAPQPSSVVLPSHTPKSALQQFATISLPRAEVRPQTVRWRSSLTSRSLPSNSSLPLSPHELKFALQPFAT